MAAESSHDEIVTSSEEPNNSEWLINIMTKHGREQKGGKSEDLEHKRPKPKIPKVDKTLRQIKSNNRCFDPSVVSFGPYHYGLPHLMRMEPDKNVAIAWFISLVKDEPANDITNKAKKVYRNFKEKVSSPRDWYNYDGLSFRFRSESEHFMRMMFRDGCFILHFIHHVVTGSSSDEYISKNSHHFNQKHIASDIFLLENQIPFPVLKYLMSLLPDQEMSGSSIIKFISMLFLPSYEMNSSRTCWLRVMIWVFKLCSPPIWKDIFQSMWKHLFEGEGKEPLHLLHVLREVLLGVGNSTAGGTADYWYYYFRPIRELKAAGIQVRRSRGMTLKHLKFKGGLLNSHLEIPQIIVDDSTVARLLNLVAYEMCPDGPKDSKITSYVCLLDSLIDHADDVDELQKENILLNRLGGNEDVAILFKELAANLSPDSNAYGLVINGIKDHFERHFNNERVKIGKWIGQFIRTYFSSPWTLISLIAAAFIIVLTLLQTIYTMWGFYKTY